MDKKPSLHAPTTNTLAPTVTRLSHKAIASTSLTCDRRAILAALRESRRRPKTALVVGPAPDSALRGLLPLSTLPKAALPPPSGGQGHAA